jgi:hypothetical protein
MPDNEKKHAYVMVTVASGCDPNAVAKAITNLDTGKYSYIVRADIVENSPGIVAPIVEVKPKKGKYFTLEQLRTKIDDETIIDNNDCVAAAKLWPVTKHEPDPDTGKKNAGDKPGGLGSNAWG